MTGRRHSSRDLPTRQRGLAIVTAVLIVAIVSAIAAYLSLGQQVWIRLAQNLRDRAQAEEAVAGITRAAAQLLRKGPSSSPTDTLQEDWARELPPFPVEEGTVRVRITDAQARFNLNNLLTPGGGRNGSEIAVLQQLLMTLGLNQAQTISLTSSLVNWMDPNTTGSAEDAEYLTLQPPYRAAHQPMESIDELRLVRGFTPEIVEKLREHVTVLPGNTPVNINTCGPLVLSALFAKLPYSTAEALVKERDERRNPFSSTGDLETRARQAPAQDVRYHVQTEYFLVEFEARFGRLERRSLALLRRARDDKPATIIWRSAQL